MGCGTIAADLVAAICNQPPVGGTGDTAYIVNYEDISTKTVSAQNVCSAIVLKNGKIGYKYETVEDSILGETTLNKGTYIDTFQQDLTLRVHTKSELAKAFVNDSKGSRLVVIVPNLATGTAGEIKWEVYGLDSGLELNELTASTDMADQTVYTLKFGSGEKAKEGTLPKSFFITDLATTEAALESLVGNS